MMYGMKVLAGDGTQTAVNFLVHIEMEHRQEKISTNVKFEVIFTEGIVIFETQQKT
jgi:hypothetical protein